MCKAGTYIIALMCLMLGALLYMGCRINILFVEWLHLPQIFSFNLDTGHPLVYWVVYCLPDGLWYLALLLVQYRLLQRNSFVSRLFAGMALCLPFVIEGMQAFGWIKGTFDWCDMITYLFTLILFFLCVKKDLS